MDAATPAARSDLPIVRPMAQLGGPPPNQGLHDDGDLVAQYWLGLEIGGAHFHGRDGGVEVAKASEHEHGSGHAGRQDPVENPHAAEIGQAQVEDDAVVNVGESGGEASRPGLRALHLDAFELHQADTGVIGTNLVVDPQQLGETRRRLRSVRWLHLPAAALRIRPPGAQRQPGRAGFVGRAGNIVHTRSPNDPNVLRDRCIVGPPYVCASFA